MKNVFIIHGAYGNPEENWIPWLTTELKAMGYTVVAPGFPTPGGQNYDNWIQIIKPHLKDFNEETILIGHSIGATFALCILEELSITINKVILASGFVGPLGVNVFDKINHTISERDYDWDKVKSSAQSFIVLHGDSDPYVPVSKAIELGMILGTAPVIVKDGGHLNEQAGFTQFPQLLDLL